MKHNLYRQILTIVFIMFTLIYISVAIILPQVLIPIYEKNIYLYLESPLDVVKNDVSSSEISSSIAYIYVGDDITSSSNLKEVINLSTDQIMKNIKGEYGKFKYKDKTYYYKTKQENNSYVIALTGDNYGRQLRADIVEALFPVLLITLLLMLVIVAWWSQSLAQKIRHLKEKVDNLDNDNYIDKYNYKVDDELKVLANAIDDMKVTLKKQEEYKNQMYQNISHDFKTPLTVMKSYVEAIEDGVQEEKHGLKIIKQEIKKLEIKVHSLLYLNKLTYFKDMGDYKGGSINVVDLLESSIKKFEITRPDIKWQIDILDKKTEFKGTVDMWEAIIDNILSNFTRYAKSIVKITVKNHRITFYNDGPNIDKNILNDMFTPYKKGINGQFGLGLSIVKQTLTLLGYEVIAKNEKVGISFIIK